MGRKSQDDVKRRTKKNTAKEKMKRNGVYSQKHIRALDSLKTQHEKTNHKKGKDKGGRK